MARQAAAESQAAFESDLDDPKLRFLANLHEPWLQAGFIKPEDFLRAFSPRAIMQALSKEPELRAKIIEPTIGVRHKIALKKPPASAGEDLQIALEEDETDAATVLELFAPDDRAKFLEPARFWEHITESRFWLADPEDAAAHRVARRRLVFLLERALTDELLSVPDIIEGLTVPTLIEHLPTTEVCGIVEKALALGEDSAPFGTRDLIETVPLATLVDHVPLRTFWEWVVVPKIVGPQALAGENTMTVVADDGPLFDASEAHPDAEHVEDISIQIDEIRTDTEGI